MHETLGMHWVKGLLNNYSRLINLEILSNFLHTDKMMSPPPELQLSQAKLDNHRTYEPASINYLSGCMIY